MNRLLPLLAGLVAIVVLPAIVVGCAGDDEAGDSGGLSAISERLLDPRLREYSFITPSVPGEPRARVLLPRDYEDSDRRYPVLYLLHGAGAGANFWSVAGIERLIGDRQLIAVMPDGDSGFYSNWFNGENRDPPQWESFHLEELIPWVDGEFRTVASRDGRAIAGNSMGGLGALLYAAHHPDLFALAASFSGPVQVEPGPIADVLVRSGRDPAIAGEIWGPYPEQAERWRRHNPVAIAANLEGTDLVLIAGDGRVPGSHRVVNPLEAEIGVMNAVLHGRLNGLGVDHVYEPGPGLHDVPYWRRALGRTLPKIESALELAPVGAPAASAG